MRIQFTKRFGLAGNSVKCDSHLNCGNRIQHGEAHWRSGSLAGNNRYGICQQCFGFWLSRYSDFDYVGALDAKDKQWNLYWDKEWESKCLKESSLDLTLPVEPIVLSPIPIHA